MIEKISFKVENADLIYNLPLIDKSMKEIISEL